MKRRPYIAPDYRRHGVPHRIGANPFRAPLRLDWLLIGTVAFGLAASAIVGYGFGVGL